LNKKTWQTCDFPVWERVKHIVPVYNVHPSYKLNNLGKILRIMFFSGDFQGQEGVCIMHQCALYNPKYGIWVTKKFSQIKTIKCPKGVKKKISLFFGFHGNGKYFLNTNVEKIY
jgi:hypothetical protein